MLRVLYDRVLRVRPDRTDDPGRDRFLLSEGHGPMAYCAVLVEKGFLDPAELDSWAGFGSRLGQHPDGVLAPGVEIGSGSLGHGLPLGAGVVRGLRARGRTDRAWSCCSATPNSTREQPRGDRRGRTPGLEQLTAVVVDDSSARHGWPGGIADRFVREGWAARTADGRDHDDLHRALTEPHPDRPLAVVAVVEPFYEEMS